MPSLSVPSLSVLTRRSRFRPPVGRCVPGGAQRGTGAGFSSPCGRRRPDRARWRRSCWWSTSRSARWCWPRCWSSPGPGQAALDELAGGYTAAERGFELRRVAGGLAALHPAGVRTVRRTVRAGRAARPADPGGAGDPGRGRVQAAGDPVADLGHPGCQLRRGDPYAGHPGPDRGVRHRAGQRGLPVPDHHAVPGEARPRQRRRAAAAGAVPARRRGRDRRCPR